MMSSHLITFSLALLTSVACATSLCAQAPPSSAAAQIQLGPWQLVRGHHEGPGQWRDVRLLAGPFTLMAKRLRVKDTDLILEGEVRLIGDPAWRLLAPIAHASLDAHEVIFLSDATGEAKLAQRALKITIGALSISLIFEPTSPVKLTLESPFAPVPQRS